ncbi:MAG: hemin uptake protein HemP [Natronohydrobacter sp.]|nr:hemin uptake protein HemP [Natronohydrobacter sp.]
MQHESSPAAPPRVDSIPTHSAEYLTGGGTTALIQLQGQIYTLRITRAGKLILTK